MSELIIKTIIEGIGLGALLVLVCAIGIRKGAVGMVHLYSPKVQERCVSLGLTTHEKIRRNALLFKIICMPGYIAYVLVPPQRESIKDYRRITCEKGKYLAKQPQNFRNEPTSSQKTMNQTVKTMHRIALVFAMESCMKNA